MNTPRSYMLLSIAVALLTIALKSGAYFITGSVGLLSDALESGVNLVAALGAFWALTYAAKPADQEHPFGHSKAEYFSSGLESALILIAAFGIAVTAWERLWAPQPLSAIGWGLGLSLVATVLNGGVALILLRAGNRFNSIALKADAAHLLTDVWTSVGVGVGIILVNVTGWLVLDSLVAFLVALNILWTGIQLLQESGSSLLDRAIPLTEQAQITDILKDYEKQGIQFHALKTRAAGVRRFITLHVLVPGIWSVEQGHSICEEVEQAIAQALPGSSITTHLEPKEDPRSWDDEMF